MRIDYPRAGRTGVRRWLPSWRQGLSLLGIGFVLMVIGGAFAYASVKIPAPNELATAQTSILYYRDGVELARLAEVNRTDVPLTDVPESVQHAVLAAEDRDFYDHGGFSPSGIVRAAWNDVRGGDLQGGSTITQQYAKNYYLTQDRTVARKARELVLSVKLSQSRSKERILQDYLNTIYFGRGAYGIEAASRAYFGVPASSLTTAQGAVLASIIRSPAGYSPENNKDRLQGRWNYTLDGMVTKGWMTADERASIAFPEVIERTTASKFGGYTGYLVDMAKKELATLGYTEDDINRGGLRVTTTFDREAERAAYKAVADKGPESGTKGLRIGMVAVKPGTGEVIAVYGGKNFLKDPFNNSTQGVSQAGSTFKPFALAAALENGYSLNDRFSGSSPRTFEFDGFAPYKVPNFGGEGFGRISLLKATESSVNTVYVDLEQQIGPDKVVDAAVRAGVPENTPGLEALPSTVLGTSTPHTIDMASAYATFASGGLYAKPFVIKEVTKSNGGLGYRAAPAPSRVFESDVTDDVTYALSRVVTRGSGFAAQDLDRPAAGKTGTTNNNQSAWFVGYTPQIAIAVSMSKGNDDQSIASLRGTGGLSTVTGGSFPARMWTEFAKLYLENYPVENFNGRAGDSFGRDRTGNGSDNGNGNNNQPRASSTPTPSTTGTPGPTKQPTAAPTTQPTTEPTPDPTVPPQTPKASKLPKP